MFASRPPGLRRASHRAGFLLIASLGVGTASPGNAQEDTLLTPAVVQLSLDQGPSEVVSALAYNSTLLLPLRRFLAMAEIRLAAYAPEDSAVAILEPGGLHVGFHPARGRLFRGDTLIALGAYDAVWWDDDLFVATAVLDRSFGIASVVEWSNLTALVGQTAGLPVVRRARRERRHALLVVSPPQPDALELHPSERLADGGVASWSLYASASAPTRDYVLDLGFGGKVFGGSTELRPRWWSVGGEPASRLEASWTRAWTDRPWLRQVRLGHVGSGGRRSRLIEGVVITNAPFIRSSEFELTQVTGAVPQGWEVELYDRGRLLAYREGDGPGPFSLPLRLRYGSNPFELVMYGPAGEVVRQERTVRVPVSRLPTGQFEYSVAGGRCRFEPCDAMLSADARYGYASRLTFQAGWDAFIRGSQTDVWQPYVIVSGAPTPALVLTGEAVARGHVRATAGLEPSDNLRLTAGHTALAQAGQPFAGTFLERHRTEASAFWRPGRILRGTLYMQAAGTRSTAPGSVRESEQAAVSARLGQARYSVGVRHDAFRREGAADVTRFAFDLGGDAVLTGRRQWLRSTTVRGLLSIEPSHGLGQIMANAGRRVGGVRVDVGLGWSRMSGVTLDVGLTSALRGPRVGTRNRFSGRSGNNGVVFVNGSAAWDPDARFVRWSDGSDLGRAGISGIVYLDANGNGWRDPAEPGLPNIPVRVGGWSEETDTDGRFNAWDLYPYEPIDIDVDSLAFADPRYVLPARVIRVRPAPNTFLEVEIPVVVGAELGGYVILNDAGVGGLPIVFRELTTGLEMRCLTYTDGGFYRAGVPPGEWEVTLPDEVIEHLNVTVPPLHIFVPPGSGEKRFEDLILRLEPR
jgi:hypothetical protein